jgi:hypothetical protein
MVCNMQLILLQSVLMQSTEMLVAGQWGGSIPDDFGAILQHMEVRVMQPRQ